MASDMEKLIGPRVPADELKAHRARYLTLTLIFAAAAILLVISMFLPYWSLTLHAPQYPQGLTVTAYVNHLEGDVSEIDGLNHYIGMRKLDEAAQFEKQVSLYGIIGVALLMLAAVFVHNGWAALLVLPALGTGKIAQFLTEAVPEIGLWLAIVASGLILVGLYFHRRAYKPLADAQKQAARAVSAAAQPASDRS